MFRRPASAGRCNAERRFFPLQSRLSRGDKTAATVSFAEGMASAVDLERIADFASEERNPENRKHVTGIVIELPSQVGAQLNLELPTHLVSTVGADEALLVQWYDHELKLLCTRGRALVEASLRRKAGRLRELVVAVLEPRSGRQRPGLADDDGSHAESSVAELCAQGEAAIKEAD